MTSFLNSTNISKYIFRVCHILPMAIVGGKLFLDNFFEYKLVDESKQEKLETIFKIAALVMTIGGFVNIFLLQAGKNMNKKVHKGPYLLWTIIIHIKFLSMIFFCDYLLQFIAPQLLENPTKLSKSRFHIFLMWTLITPFLRFWREHYTKLNTLKSKSN